MSWKNALLAAAALALPIAAQAQPVTGFYVGAGAGATWLGDSDIELSGPGFSGFTGAQRNGNIDFNTGFVGAVSLGYGYGNGLRAEVEFSYRDNEVDSVTGFAPAGPTRSTGNIQSYAFMLNALYDFNIGLPVYPYLGVGIGAVQVDFDGVRQSNTTGPVNIVQVPGSALRFGYQAIVGAALPISAVPGLSLTAEYRFLGTAAGENVDAFLFRPTGRVQGSTDFDYFSHSVMLGLRYAFGAPPAPPPVVAPAAAPAPARTFLVFFDFDKATLTDRARQIIAEAANNAQQTGTTRIEIAGHTDTVGSARYNQGLSERRANAVAAELERRGVPRSQMVLQGFGFTRLLVPTAPNVREPQNRRVEIVLR